MCTIALAPAGKVLSGNKFRNCFRINPDGAGFAFVDNQGDIQIYKGYFDPKEMLTDYRNKLDECPDSPFLLHWRIATQGLISTQNSHPFEIRDDLVMAHNGHIAGYGNKTKSDTLMFALQILANLPDRFEEQPAILRLIEGHIGSDKMVLLRNDKQYSILNEYYGEWSKDGIWFSNTAYRRNKSARTKWSKTSCSSTRSGNNGSSTNTAAWTEAERQSYEQAWGEILKYEGEPCSLCSKNLDMYDAEIACEVGAGSPLCYECITDEEENLLQWSMINRPLDPLWGCN